MSIDLDVEMIVPQQSEQSVPVFKDVSVIVNHFLKNGVLIKRVEALGREAMVFNGTGSEIANRYKTEFDILNAFFVTFTPKTPEDYLCLIGNDQIDFYSQDANGGICCPIALPFKVLFDYEVFINFYPQICCAHPCSFGIILERSSFPGEYGNPPGAAQLFSLTHPYNEIMPILCKFKGDSGCHYTFRGKRMAVVSKDIAANWCSSFFGPIDLLMCYDFDERRNNLFLIRKCTKEERLAAKNDLGVLNSSALMHTPSTVRSFYSPNFFNRRFAENRLATIGLLNAQKNNTDTHLHQSPASCFNPILFGNSNGSSHLHPASQTTSASMTSSVPNTAPSKTPITRRITRSMAAAAATAEFSNHTFGMGALSSLPSSTADKSGSFHRSLEHNAALNRMRLKQKLSLAAGSNAVSNAYINNSTPRHAHSISAADMDDLLSFGGRETDDEPPSSLIMAVEFCLDWLWSEPLPPPIDDAYANRSGSTSSVIAQKLETLRVSSSTSSQSDEATNKINNG
uniref:Anaphase-promoting complex subunit 1 n=1 Tax=Meloidogyne hapla TaxID=6305 RepID=A0A1I8B937_MELHA